MLRFTNLVLGFATFYLASARSNGAPAGPCSSLMPKHPAQNGSLFPPQTSDVPYVIDFSVFEVVNGAYVYEPGRTYTLTFEDPTANGLQFRGFFIQSRLATDMMTLVGEFTVTDRNNSKLRPCGNDDPNGITHTNKNDKDSVSMNWTAPLEGTGPIQFAYAAVKVLDTFWANERSEMLQEGAAALAVSTLGLLLSLGAVLLF